MGDRPAYRRLLETGELAARAAQARERLAPCRVCPRHCDVDRPAGELGECGVGARALVASFGAHHGEEAPLSGWRGSGTIFFAGCNLHCVFCQNHGISQQREGSEVGAAELAEMMLELQTQGCHNINWVTPSHQVPQILEALVTAAARGLRLPLVYNTSAYDDLEMLRLLDGVVDIYLPDFKYADRDIAERYSAAPDYPAIAKAALREMHRQVGDLVTDKNGIAVRGLMVRHLVLPGGLAGTREAMRFLADELSRDTYVNVMDQYRPCHQAHRYPELARTISGAEFLAAMRAARESGLHRIDGEPAGRESRS